MGEGPKPTLPGLPGELIDHIVRGLVDIDVAALHAVNQELREKTKYAYAKRYLTRIHVFLHPVSFNELTRLAHDPIYGPLIEHITISTYVLRDQNERRKGSSMYPPPFSQSCWNLLTLEQASSPGSKKNRSSLDLRHRRSRMHLGRPRR